MTTTDRLKILVILSRIPFPLEKGDKLRAYHQLRVLSRDHEVHLVALHDSNEVPQGAYEELSAFLASVHFFKLPRRVIYWQIFKAWIKGLPLQVGYFYNGRVAKAVRAMAHEIQPDHLYCQLVRTAAYAKGISVPKTIDYQDVFSVGALRQAEKAKPWMRPILHLEHRRLRRYERAVFSQFDHHTIISLPDRELIPHQQRDRITLVPNGVDTEYFSPIEQEKDIDILFTGNMGYPPNVDACRFLIHEIMPVVWKHLPSAKVMLAGASPHTEVKSMASHQVIVTGWVDDIRVCYARSKVFIAPMRIGTGLQNKILEAMSMGLPCITTSLAFTALHEGASGLIRVGDDAHTLAHHLIHQLKDEIEFDQQGIDSRSFVMAHYHWTQATRILEQLIRSSHQKPA